MRTGRQETRDQITVSDGKDYSNVTKKSNLSRLKNELQYPICGSGQHKPGESFGGMMENVNLEERKVSFGLITSRNSKMNQINQIQKGFFFLI